MAEPGPGELATREPFVGRERELSLLRSALADARTGLQRLVLLTGEAGIGKTTVARRFCDEVGDGSLIAWSRGWAGEGMPLLWPWIQVLRDLGFAQAPGAPDPLARDAGPEREFQRFERVTDLLASVAGPRCPILVFEDLHLADDATLRLLRFVIRDPRRMGLLLLGTCREDPGGASEPALRSLLGDAAASHVALPGLDASQVASQIEQLEGCAPSAERAAAVRRVTGGNPLFVAELARMGVAAPDVDGRTQLPARIQEAIASRLEGVSASCRRAVELAAVLDAPVGFPLLRSVWERFEGRSISEMDLPRGLDEAERHRLLLRSSERGSYAFPHQLLREAIYRGIPPAQRGVLHRHCAEAISQLYREDLEPHLAHLSLHLVEALEAGAEAAKAVDVASRAGYQAIGRVAYPEAARHFRRALCALDFAPDPADAGDDRWRRRAHLLLDLGEAESRSALPSSAEHFRAAAAIARRRLPDPDAARVLARAALGPPEPSEATPGLDAEVVARCEEALGVLTGDDASLQVQLLARLSALLRGARDGGRRSAAAARDAVAIARQLGDPSALACALGSHHRALWSSPDVEDRLSISSEALRMAIESGDPRLEHQSRFWRVLDLLDLGRVAQADIEIEAIADLAVRLREPARAYPAAYLRAGRAYMGGRLDEAERLAEEALALGERAAIPDAPLNYLMQLYTLRFEQGRLDELQAILQRTTRFFDRIPALQVMTSLVLFRSGRPDEARAALIESAREHFAHIPRDSNWLPTLYAAAIVASELSLGEVARDLYELLGPHAHRNLSANHGAVNSGSVGRARAALAECLGRPDDALVQFERALESDERLGSVPAVLNTQILFGPVLLRRGDEDSRRRGRAMLESVIEKGEPLGFARLASKARAALAAAPADPQPATGLRACWHEGEFWTLRFEGRTHRVRDAKGMRFIAQLLARPAQALAATQLVAYESPAAWIPDGVAGGAVAELEVVGSLGDAGPRLDERARREYAAHLSDLRTERDEAERLHDLGRLSAATEQIEWLSRELATASGLDGRPRRSASHVERARLAVRQRIKATFDRLERSDPALARFLTARIRTGTVCAYEPAPGEPPWDVRLPR